MGRSPRQRTRAQANARARESQARYKRNVAKLQHAGLLGKIDTKKKKDPKAQRAIIKYADYLNGKASAIKTKDAKEISQKFGFKKRGDVVLVPRQKYEKVTINQKGEVVTRYPNPLFKKGLSEHKTVTRKFGQKGLPAPPKPGEKIYYTIRERRRGLGKIKRTTFDKFDDLLEYLSAYEIDWEDVEPFFETETVGPRKADKLDETIRRERRAGHERWQRRRRRRKAKPRKRK